MKSVWNPKKIYDNWTKYWELLKCWKTEIWRLDDRKSYNWTYVPLDAGFMMVGSWKTNTESNKFKERLHQIWCMSSPAFECAPHGASCYWMRSSSKDFQLHVTSLLWKWHHGRQQENLDHVRRWCWLVLKLQELNRRSSCGAQRWARLTDRGYSVRQLIEAGDLRLHDSWLLLMSRGL